MSNLKTLKTLKDIETETIVIGCFDCGTGKEISVHSSILRQAAREHIKALKAENLDYVTYLNVQVEKNADYIITEVKIASNLKTIVWIESFFNLDDEL